MDVEFLGQPFAEERRLGHVLGELLQDAVSFHAVTAWAQTSGLRQVEAAIQGLRARGGTASAILGIDGGIATREALQLAIELFDPVLVFHDAGSRLFHPKLYWVESPSCVSIVVGSSNLTGAGLFASYEANLLVRLDPADPADQEVLDAVGAFRDSLVDTAMPCEPLTAELIERLGEEESLLTTGKRRAEREAAARSKADGLAREIFGAPVAGLPGLPSVPGSDGNGEVAAAGEPKPPSTAAPELRWWKRMTASDVLRKPEGSHPRNYVVLTKKGHKHIDQKVWFRDELFASVGWEDQTMRTGRVKEVAEVPFEVHVDGEYLGEIALRIDHAEGRIADQGNSPTYLNWSAMIDVIRENDFRDWWLELARLEDGKFRLRLLPEEPLAA